MDPMLIRCAERAAADPYYLAHLLGPDLRAAAERLAISVEACYHLYLCPVPKSACEVRAIVERGWVSEERLREVLG